MRPYGVPYLGSKSQLAGWIISHLPSGRRLVDLFGGGGAITHCAAMSGRWRYVHANDIDGAGLELFRRAQAGVYRDWHEWVSAEEYRRVARDPAMGFDDPIIPACYSFSNKIRYYAYGADNCRAARAIHRYVYDGDDTEIRALLPEFDGSALSSVPVVAARAIANAIIAHGMPAEIVHITRLARVNAIADDAMVATITYSRASYDVVAIEAGDVVYADPPYASTTQYLNSRCECIGFDSARFWGWVRSRNYPVYVSEYNAPDDYVIVASMSRRSGLASRQQSASPERLYIHRRWAGNMDVLPLFTPPPHR